ncbi:MAG: glycosyltransferase family 39 protein, partial [Caldilineaceae bacterium]|nr:glycosyltransferase family 39 protein [Caldilineaceae bacterium]
MSIGNHRQRLLLLLGILSAFGLRLFHLGQESLWYDETVSVVLARKSVPALIAHTAGDIHPPGYYLLLHLWQQLVNPTLAHGLEYLFAWPSVLFGMLMVVLLYPLGRRLFAPGVAGVGLWLAAMHPYQIWYSQEVRMYTVGATLGLLCLWAAVNVFHATAPVNTTAERQPHGIPQGKRRWWLLLYVIAGALGLYTLYYFLFLLIAVNLLALCYLLLPISSQEHSSNLSPSSRPRFLDWSGAQLLLLLLWSPWLPIFWRQATAPPVPPWRVPWHSVTTLLAAGSESISALVVGQSAPFADHWVWLLIGGLLLSTAFLYYTNEQQAGVTVVLLYALLPITLIYLITALLT